MRRPIVVGLCILLLGCAGSTSQVVNVDLSSSQGGVLCLMPFNSNFDREYYSDAHTRYNISLLGGLIAQAIDERSGAYTYTFDEDDLENLRNSILSTLSEAEHFSEVKDVVAALPEDADGDLLLFVDFERMGVDQKVRFIVEILGEIKVTDGSGAELAARNVHISEKGTWTLTAAKDRAIEAFVREVEAVLNSI